MGGHEFTQTNVRPPTTLFLESPNNWTDNPDSQKEGERERRGVREGKEETRKKNRNSFLSECLFDQTFYIRDDCGHVNTRGQCSSFSKIY